MNSSLIFVLCLAISVLSGANGAPAHLDGEVNYTECKKLTIQLNELARDLYHKVESPNMSSIVDEPPVSIRPVDTCDPWSLQNNKVNKTCQSRIILALKNYTRIFDWHGVFKNSACSKWREQANEIAKITGNLLRALKQPVIHAPLNTVDWHDNALCRDSVERLYSFSIVSARVFSFLASPVEPDGEIKQC